VSETSYLNLYTSATATFGALHCAFADADHVVIGVPFDVTSTFRSGSRFAPLAIREASLNIEAYSFRTGMDLEELRLHDAGDLHVTGDAEETLRRLGLVAGEVLNGGKTPGFLGGEHTISLGAVRGINKDLAVLCFDAHLDLRDDYSNQKVCHATVMRRISETVKPSMLVEVGTRAACREEVEYAEDQGIVYITSYRIMQMGAEETAKEIKAQLAGCDRVYLTVDMDVLDPAFAPAVQNPEPEGLSTTMLLDILFKICGNRVIAFDVTEVTPQYDSGATAIQAARVVFEILSYLQRDKPVGSNAR